MAGFSGGSFRRGFSGGFGGGSFGRASTSATPEEILERQLASMRDTLGQTGINYTPKDQRTWVEKLIDTLNKPLGVTTSLLSGLDADVSAGDALKKAGNVLIGKEKYGTKELLNEYFGESDSFGRKAAEFGLGIPLDPLTWLPVGKMIAGVGNTGLKTARNIAIAKGAGTSNPLRYVNTIDDITKQFTKAKNFLGYRDYAEFAAKPAIKGMVNGKEVILQAATPDLREAMRTADTLRKSLDPMRTFYAEGYADKFKGSIEKFQKMKPEDWGNMLETVESKGKRMLGGVKPTAYHRGLAKEWQQIQKFLGDEQVMAQAIGEGKSTLGRKLAGRVGGKESAGYVEHVLTPEWKKAFPTLESLPENLRTKLKPFYEMSEKAVKGRKINAHISTINKNSLENFGVKIFEDNPLSILNASFNKVSNIKARKEIIDSLKDLKGPDGEPLILSAKKMFPGLKDTPGRDDAIKQLITSVKEGTPKETAKLYKQLTGKGGYKDLPDIKKFFEGKVKKEATSIPGMMEIKNPFFAKRGSLTQASPELASMVDKFSDMFPKKTDNPLLQMTDQINTLFKKGNITNPRFHINNFIGATLNNFIDDPIGTIKNWPIVKQIMKGGDNMVTMNNVTKSADDWLTHLKKFGALGGFAKIEANARMNPLAKVHKFSGDIGGKIELQARLQAFVNNVQKGKSPMESLQRVFQIHGNYNRAAFTDFENNVMKRLIPFYTWTKTSVPYQTSMLLQKPQLYANTARLQQAMIGDQMKDMPSWMREVMPFATAGSGDKKSALSINAPLQDLELLADPLGTIASKLSPLARFPLEVGRNKQFWQDKTIYDPNRITETGKTQGAVSQYADYAQDFLPYMNFFKSLTKNANNQLIRYDQPLEENTLDTFKGDPIKYIMAVIAGQLDPTNPKKYDPALELYSRNKDEQMRMMSLISRLRREGILPPAK
jgi:hypothetical protein